VTPLKVIGYLRVSTDAQAERGLGLDVQEHAIRRWARDRGHRLVRVLRDAGVSGSNGVEGRIALAEALAAIPREAAGLVVYRLDRLARDLVLQEQLLAETRRLGGEVFSTASSESAFLKDDPDDPSRRLIRQVLGAIAEYERAMIVLRLRAGRARKAERGGFAYGSPPFGWRAENGQLVAHEGEQEVLHRLLALDCQGASLRDIARTLNRERRLPKRGGRWHPESVRRVLARSKPELSSTT